jgi:hypothetical protein
MIMITTAGRPSPQLEEHLMAADKGKHVRSILPIPDVRKSEHTAYGAKDPESRFPPIEPVLPPKRAPNELAGGRVPRCHLAG